MKLNKVLIHARIPMRTKERMKTIQAYMAKTATSIIEDALEKGLNWYLKQIQAEMGRTKENPLTWQELAGMAKLSETSQEDSTPQEEISNEQVEESLKELFPDDEAAKEKI